MSFRNLSQAGGRDSTRCILLCGLLHKRIRIENENKNNACTLCFSLFVFSTFNYFRSYGTTFKSGTYIYWYGFEPFVLSVLLFLLIKRIKADNFPKAAKIALWKVSDLALGIYLISFIFDSIVYPVLCEKVILMPDRLPYYFVTVPIVFVLSAAASFIMNLVAKLLIDGFKSLANTIKDLRSKPDKGKWQHIIFAVLMAFAIGFSLWKCYYGFGGNDESFYLTIPHRLTLGDSLLGDEWHLTQLSGFLLLPFVWLYTMITQSTVGIIFAARVFYVICHAVIVCVIYSRLKSTDISQYSVVCFISSLHHLTLWH